jgi:CubicO group peptidase (beta-lactamase class C family)
MCKLLYLSSAKTEGALLIPYQPDFQLSYPAGSCNSTAADMGHYISMFLYNGNFKGNQILDTTSVFKMFHTGFRHYDKSEYGWLLDFPESQWHGMSLIGHGGAIQGFESQLSLIPEKNIGVFISTNSSSYPNSKSRVFIDQFIYNLFARLIPDSIDKKEEAKVSPTTGSVDEPLEKFSGTYRYTQYAQTTFDKVAILIGLAPEIKIVSKDNTLEILEWDDKLIPVSDLTFHSKYDRYLAFGRNTKG